MEKKIYALTLTRHPELVSGSNKRKFLFLSKHFPPISFFLAQTLLCKKKKLLLIFKRCVMLNLHLLVGELASLTRLGPGRGFQHLLKIKPPFQLAHWGNFQRSPSKERKDVGFLPPGKFLSEICPLASLCSRSQRRVIAFTLAEVLITLAIIGVVAALTIPTVVRNYQKQQTVVRLKKVYSALANTTNLAIADHGPIDGWEVEHYSVSGASENFANKYVIPYLKISRNCGIQWDGICRMDYKYLNGTGEGHLSPSYARFILNDGTYVAVASYNYENVRRAQILVDVNGQKQPNKFGKDIFDFTYYINYDNKIGKFMPRCSDYSREQLLQTCNKGSLGTCCSGFIAHDGWQIKDDYPW